MHINGIIPPVAMPMQANEDLDLPRLKWFLDWLIAHSKPICEWRIRSMRCGPVTQGAETFDMPGEYATLPTSERGWQTAKPR